MEKQIIIPATQYTLNQEIGVITEKGQMEIFHETTERLPEFVVDMAKSLDIKKISFRGNKTYIEGLIEKFKKYEKKEYTFNSLKYVIE